MKLRLAQIRSKGSSLLRRFRNDARGNVALITGLCALPLFVAAGVAIDVARASRSHSALQVAVDAAALAAAASDKASLAGLTDTQKAARKQELKKLAEDVLKANYHDEGQDVTADVEITDKTVTVVGHKVYPTTLMNLAGFRTMNLDARAEVNLKGGLAENIEIVLVMDTTGSMKDDNKLVDAKAAARKLLETVLGDEPSDEHVRFALVPFSGSVNVGADKLNSGWIDTTGKSSASKVNFTDPTYHNMKAWNDMKYVNPQGVTVKLPWNGCVEARLGNLNTDDTPPSVATPNTLFTPYMAPDEGDYYYNSYISNESGSTDELKQKNQDKYANKTFTSLTGENGPWYNCASSSIVALTPSRAAIEQGVDAMVARGPTNLPEGFTWGWRVMSPNAPYTDGAAYNNKDWRKVIVFMTDGMNDPGAGLNGFNKSVYTAYGYGAAPIAKNRFGTTSSNQLVSKMNTKLLTACSKVKAQAEMRPDPRSSSKQIPSIEIYTIAFKTTDDAKNLLRQCATSESYFIDASDGDELQKGFADIGARLRTLYLSK